MPGLKQEQPNFKVILGYKSRPSLKKKESEDTSQSKCVIEFLCLRWECYVGEAGRQGVHGHLWGGQDGVRMESAWWHAPEHLSTHKTVPRRWLISPLEYPRAGGEEACCKEESPGKGS